MINRFTAPFSTAECYSCKGGCCCSHICRMQGICGLSHFARFKIHSRHVVGNCVVIIWISAPANNIENVYKDKIWYDTGLFLRAGQAFERLACQCASGHAAFAYFIATYLHQKRIQTCRSNRPQRLDCGNLFLLLLSFHPSSSLSLRSSVRALKYASQ